MPEQEKEKNRPLVGVSVLIRQGARILLEKRSKAPMEGAWKAPGGHMEFGEIPEHAALREVHEELGIEIDNLKFRTVTNDVFNEFFIYVPTVLGVEALPSINPLEDEDEEHNPAPLNKKTWIKIPLSEELIVYAHHWDDDEEEDLS